MQDRSSQKIAVLKPHVIMLCLGWVTNRTVCTMDGEDHNWDMVNLSDIRDPCLQQEIWTDSDSGKSRLKSQGGCNETLSYNQNQLAFLLELLRFLEILSRVNQEDC